MLFRSLRFRWCCGFRKSQLKRPDFGVVIQFHYHYLLKHRELSGRRAAADDLIDIASHCCPKKRSTGFQIALHYLSSLLKLKVAGFQVLQQRNRFILH